MLVYGLENKIKILFEYARIYEDGLVLDDAIEVYNMMEYAVSNDLTEFKANMLAAYSLMSEKYGEVIISNNNLFEFFTKYSLCQMLMIRVSVN